MNNIRFPVWLTFALFLFPLLGLAAPVFFPANTNSVAAANQPYVQAFMAAAKIQDLSVQSDLDGFVNELNKWGILKGTNGTLVRAYLFGSRFNPGYNVEFTGNTFTPSNAVWVADGLQCWGSNIVSGSLPNLTNYTVVIMLKRPPGWWYDQCNYSPRAAYAGIQFTVEADLVSTNDSSLFALCRQTTADTLWENAGTNSMYGGAWGNNSYGTNIGQPLCNGQFDGRDIFGNKVYAMTGSNGIHQLFESTHPERFYLTGPRYYTNVFAAPNPPTSPYNKINIGGDSLFCSYPVGPGQNPDFSNTNFAGTIYAVMVFNGSDSNIVAGAYAASAWLYDSSEHWFIQGDSLLSYWQGDAADNPSFSPATNAIPNLIAAANPRVILHVESAPGSTVAANARLSGGWVGFNTFPITATSLLPRAKVKVVRMITDSWHNDALNSASGDYALAMYTNWYTRYLPYVTYWNLIIPYGAPGYSSAQIAAVYKAGAMIASNWPTAQVTRWCDYVTLNMMANTNLSRDGIHPWGFTAAAHNLDLDLANLVDGIPWPEQDKDTAISPITLSGSPVSWTNSNMFPVDFMFGGSKITGVMVDATNRLPFTSGTVALRAGEYITLSHRGILSAAWKLR